MLTILTQSRLGKIRFKHKPIEHPNCEKFTFENRIYSVHHNKATKEYTIFARDQGGTSIINVEELFVDSNKNPALADLPLGVKKEEPDDVMIEFDDLPKSSLSIEEIPQLEPAEKIQLKPFGPVERSSERPLVFDVLRMLNLIGNPNVQILPNTEEVERYITELDKISVLGTAYIPIYYVNQDSKSVSDVWNDNFVSRFFHSFEKDYNKTDCYCITTNAIRFAYTKFDFEKCSGSQIAIILNDTDMQLNSSVINSMKQKLVVSISPLEGNLFKLCFEKNEFDHYLPFGNDRKPKLLISASKLVFHFVYMGFYSFISDSDVFTKMMRKRSIFLNEIPKGISPIEYLCK